MAPIIDVHTHMYPPSYLSILQSRTTVPYLHVPPQPAQPRLIILPSDDDPQVPISDRGRPVGPEYSSVEQKLSFMKTHDITASVISLANPWLDFVDPTEAPTIAKLINNEMESLCADNPGKLYAFATLPLSAPVAQIVDEVNRLASCHYIRGIILGTSGLGTGLDDPALAPVWRALQEAQLLIFVHPHYGLPKEVYGPRQSESGHVLPLALGFPMETTIAFVRMYLAGVFDSFPDLKVLLAHSGGTVPFLAGRLESCVLHERIFRDKKGNMQSQRKGIWEVMKRNIWLDGVVYSEVGLKAAIEAVGKERVLFGTDHPFFPPLEEGQVEWASVGMNVHAARKASGEDKESADAVLGGNAIRLLNLEPSS